MSQRGISRRHFFFGTLLAGAIPAGGYGSVPSLRALGYKPFYEKLNVAAIGCGGQGGSILNQAARTENIVALCDVDENRAAENFKRFDKQPKYKDFRVMLEKEGKNVDACTIGIPDHMHATVALACMQLGKHVYLEKPLTRTPWEARLMADAAGISSIMPGSPQYPTCLLIVPSRSRNTARAPMRECWRALRRGQGGAMARGPQTRAPFVVPV
jgi:hypothetical protein